MVGFSFLHTSPLALPVLASATLAQLWVILVTVWVAYVAWRREGIDRAVWIQLASLGVPVLMLFFTPAISG
jgi:hypothetical protein